MTSVARGILSGFRLKAAERARAMAPVTWGAAKLVPDRGGPAAEGVPAVALWMSIPGATMSGFSRPKAVGPSDDCSYRLTTDLGAMAPTQITAGVVPGMVTVNPSAGRRNFVVRGPLSIQPCIGSGLMSSPPENVIRHVPAGRRLSGKGVRSSFSRARARPSRSRRGRACPSPARRAREAAGRGSCG